MDALETCRKNKLSPTGTSVSLPSSEGGVVRLQVTLLAEPDLATSDLYSHQRETLLQRPGVHDGPDVQLIAGEPLLQAQNKPGEVRAAAGTRGFSATERTEAAERRPRAEQNSACFLSPSSRRPGLQSCQRPDNKQSDGNPRARSYWENDTFDF